ncbi:MAG TPA: zinc ABC transporter substrate-binding protein [Azospirillaceae bacterium]|nr:zinc ABC transporter substrate-binding protein [Azospirillaceae bacterium]
MTPFRPLAPVLLALGLLFAPSALAAPQVVASVKPLHSLAASLMQGVGEPHLLVRGTATPHAFALKPSDARALAQAALVFWMGPELEAFLQKPLAGNGKAVALLAAPGVQGKPARRGGAWEAHDPGHAHDHGHEAGGAVDPHAWLDPRNARAMAEAMAAALVRADPANAARYQANLATLSADLDALDRELEGVLAPVRTKPFVVFHDAYHYLEDRYGLNAVGALTVNPERPPGAARLSELRARIRDLGAACVFAEPQFEPALVDTLIAGTPARKGVLDPEGAAIPDGPELYFALMRANARALTGCLGG